MARKRLLSSSLGGSDKFFDLQELAGELAEFSQTLYCLGVAHHDELGQFSASPRTWKLNVHPGSPRPISDFEKAIHFLIQADLLELSVCVKAVRFVNYEKIQVFRKDRTAINDYPNCQWRSMTVNDGFTFLNRSKEKLREVKGSEDKKEGNLPLPSPLQEKFIKIVNLYPKEFKLRLIEDAQWLKDRVLNEPQFKSLDLEYELDGWGTWLEAESRKKASRQANQFPKSDFKRSLTNRFNNALKFQKKKSQKRKPPPPTETETQLPEPKNPEAFALWEKALKAIDNKLKQGPIDKLEEFDIWLTPTVGYDLVGEKLIIAVPDPFFIAWLTEHYSPLIDEALGREWELRVNDCLK